ncbi:MAG: 1-phosphofructokinase family hexose kinase, partial [Lachnospirales bacterium]
MEKNIYTLTLNPSIDYIVGIEDLEVGATNRTLYEKTIAGGKGINVSRVLKNLGVKSCAVGILGGFTGKEIISQLNKMDIDNDFLEIEENSRINIKIKDKIITEINGKGPNISENHINLLLNKIKNPYILVLSGSVPKSLGNSIYADIADKFMVPFVLDCSGDLFLKALE